MQREACPSLWLVPALKANQVGQVSLVQGDIPLFTLCEVAEVGGVGALFHAVILGQQRQHQTRKTRHGAGFVLLAHYLGQGFNRCRHCFEHLGKQCHLWHFRPALVALCTVWG